MKAKLFVFDEEKEIRLNNGVQFFATEGESVEEFTERVSEVVDRDYVDTLELDEVDEKKLKKRGSAQLEKALESATGVEAKIIGSILSARGVEVEQTEDPNEIETEAEEVTAKEAPEESEEPAPKKKEKAKKEPKPKKELPSLDSVLEAVKLAKNNVQTVCTFSPFRTAIKMTGEVKQVVIDRRVNKAYYRILGEDGKLYHTEINNPSFSVDEEATEKLADEREAEAAKKAEEKKAKAEAKKAKAKAKKEAEVESEKTEE
jgi:hypothetical protein